MNVSFVLNGKPMSVDVEPSTRLVDLLRETLDLTGTHIGCDTSQCGACLVMVDGESMKSCALLVASLEGAVVTTVEGLASPEGELHPMQQAFRENHGLQCGFCTPGMLIAAVDFANRHPSPTEAEVRGWLEGNICRCTGYQNIVKSVLAGTAAMHQSV
ncbi:(2Fe-2S)-binding protein [Amorphus sp. 3PC139-8]|uniref:(2Fe-2S)-binding protein n=1 Tax=Amorphus sp. 3PC139-8 TaxID=2735676 RepID=UPI00345D63DE